VDFPRGPKEDFFPGGGERVLKFHFTNSKLREKHPSTKL